MSEPCWQGRLLAALGLGLALSLVPLRAHASDVCEDVAALPAELQVAWVAPLGRRVGASRWLEVVRVSDLRAAARTADDPVRLLQMLGVLGRKPTEGQRNKDWQVVIFDVDAAQLCRPVEGVGAGTAIGGVPVCHEDEVSPARGHRKGWTGCGYSLDTGASTRGLDVMRVDWETASARGFCLLPLTRFVEEA